MSVSLPPHRAYRGRRVASSLTPGQALVTETDLLFQKLRNYFDVVVPVHSRVLFGVLGQGGLLLLWKYQGPEWERWRE